jgi:Fe-S oxidoreductase
MNSRAAPQRARAFEIKRKQVESSGAEALVLSCAGCRMTLLGDAQLKHWDMPLVSLVELTGDHLDESYNAGAQSAGQPPRGGS